MKFQPKQKPKSYGYSMSYGYNAAGQYGPKLPNYYGSYGKKQEEEEEQPSQTFKLVKPPSELD